MEQDRSMPAVYRPSQFIREIGDRTLCRIVGGNTATTLPATYALFEQVPNVGDIVAMTFGFTDQRLRVIAKQLEFTSNQPEHDGAQHTVLYVEHE